MRFGERLKKARSDMNLTQGDVANELYITRQTISSWKNEKTYPDISSLIQLSNYYQISLDTLLKEDTGMREDLEKKYVTVNMKKIYWKLQLCFFILLSLFIANVLDIVHLGIFYIPFLCVFIAITMTLDNIGEFDRNSTLELKYKWQKYIAGDMGSIYTLILPIMSFLFGIICLLWNKGNPWWSFICAGLLLWVNHKSTNK